VLTIGTGLGNAHFTNRGEPGDDEGKAKKARKKDKERGKEKAGEDS